MEAHAKNHDADFVGTWLESRRLAQPESGVVQAVLEATSGGRLDETDFLGN